MSSSTLSYAAWRVLAVLVVVLFVTLSLALLSQLGLIPRQVPLIAVYSIVAILSGLWLTNFLSNLVARALSTTAGRKANALGNLLKLIGYVIIAVVVLSLFGVSPEVALAGGAFSGLIIGLGAQPLLGNFFAGLVLLITGAIKPGDEVRIVTTSLPYQVASGMGYKFFSADFVNSGYRGQVVSVGLLYSTFIIETGLELKVPNQIMLNSGIINYSSELEVEGTRQVRYEFSVMLDPEETLTKVREALSDIKEVTSCYVSEQSDKQYYIVVVEFRAGDAKEWKMLKSEILKRMIRVQRQQELSLKG